MSSEEKKRQKGKRERERETEGEKGGSSKDYLFLLRKSSRLVYSLPS